MKYVIETIPHKAQKYETVGDYHTDPDGTRHILVSDMGNLDYEFLVAIHELAEQHLALKHGVSEARITEFDIKFEDARPEGNLDEPGDSPDSPYENEHCFATAIERMMAAALNVKWKDYEDATNTLYANTLTGEKA